MADYQVVDIKKWESKCGLNESLSQNYGSCLNLFIQKRFVHESDWTSYGNPRQYTLCPSVEKLLFSGKSINIAKVNEIKLAHLMVLPF